MTSLNPILELHGNDINLVAYRYVCGSSGGGSSGGGGPEVCAVTMFEKAVCPVAVVDHNGFKNTFPLPALRHSSIRSSGVLSASPAKSRRAGAAAAQYSAQNVAKRGLTRGQPLVEKQITALDLTVDCYYCVLVYLDGFVDVVPVLANPDLSPPEAFFLSDLFAGEFGPPSCCVCFYPYRVFIGSLLGNLLCLELQQEGAPEVLSKFTALPGPLLSLEMVRENDARLWLFMRVGESLLRLEVEEEEKLGENSEHRSSTGGQAGGDVTKRDVTASPALFSKKYIIDIADNLRKHKAQRIRNTEVISGIEPVSEVLICSAPSFPLRPLMQIPLCTSNAERKHERAIVGVVRTSHAGSVPCPTAGRTAGGLSSGRSSAPEDDGVVVHGSGERKKPEQHPGKIGPFTEDEQGSCAVAGRTMGGAQKMTGSCGPSPGETTDGTKPTSINKKRNSSSVVITDVLLLSQGNLVLNVVSNTKTKTAKLLLQTAQGGTNVVIQQLEISEQVIGTYLGPGTFAPGGGSGGEQCRGGDIGSESSGGLESGDSDWVTLGIIHTVSSVYALKTSRHHLRNTLQALALDLDGHGWSGAANGGGGTTLSAGPPGGPEQYRHADGTSSVSSTELCPRLEQEDEEDSLARTKKKDLLDRHLPRLCQAFVFDFDSILLNAGAESDSIQAALAVWKRRRDRQIPLTTLKESWGSDGARFIQGLVAEFFGTSGRTATAASRLHVACNEILEFLDCHWTALDLWTVNLTTYVCALQAFLPHYNADVWVAESRKSRKRSSQGPLSLGGGGPSASASPKDHQGDFGGRGGRGQKADGSCSMLKGGKQRQKSPTRTSLSAEDQYPPQPSGPLDLISLWLESEHLDNAIQAADQRFAEFCDHTLIAARRKTVLPGLPPRGRLVRAYFGLKADELLPQEIKLSKSFSAAMQGIVLGCLLEVGSVEEAVGLVLQLYQLACSLRTFADVESRASFHGGGEQVVGGVGVCCTDCPSDGILSDHIVDGNGGGSSAASIAGVGGAPSAGTSSTSVGGQQTPTASIFYFGLYMFLRRYGRNKGAMFELQREIFPAEFGDTRSASPVSSTSPVTGGSSVTPSPPGKSISSRGPSRSPGAVSSEGSSSSADSPMSGGGPGAIIPAEIRLSFRERLNVYKDSFVVEDDLESAMQSQLEPGVTVRDLWQEAVSFGNESSVVLLLPKLAKQHPWIWNKVEWTLKVRLRMCCLLYTAGAEDRHNVVVAVDGERSAVEMESLRTAAVAA